MNHYGPALSGLNVVMFMTETLEIKPSVYSLLVDMDTGCGLFLKNKYSDLTTSERDYTLNAIFQKLVFYCRTITDDYVNANEDRDLIMNKWTKREKFPNSASSLI